MAILFVPCAQSQLLPANKSGVGSTRPLPGTHETGLEGLGPEPGMERAQWSMCGERKQEDWSSNACPWLKMVEDEGADGE